MFGCRCLSFALLLRVFISGSDRCWLFFFFFFLFSFLFLWFVRVATGKQLGTEQRRAGQRSGNVEGDDADGGSSPRQSCTCTTVPLGSQWPSPLPVVDCCRALCPLRTRCLPLDERATRVLLQLLIHASYCCGLCPRSVPPSRCSVAS